MHLMKFYNKSLILFFENFLSGFVLKSKNLTKLNLNLSFLKIYIKLISYSQKKFIYN